MSNISFIGYDQQVCTFLCTNRVKPGDFVIMKDNYEVDTVCAYSNSADIQFIGKCITAQEGLAVIQLSGYVEGEIDEKIPLGYRHLSVDGNNHIQIDKSCETRLVVYSDDHKVGFIL